MHFIESMWRRTALNHSSCALYAHYTNNQSAMRVCAHLMESKRKFTCASVCVHAIQSIHIFAVNNLNQIILFESIIAGDETAAATPNENASDAFAECKSVCLCIDHYCYWFFSRLAIITLTRIQLVLFFIFTSNSNLTAFSMYNLIINKNRKEKNRKRVDMPVCKAIYSHIVWVRSRLSKSSTDIQIEWNAYTDTHALPICFHFRYSLHFADIICVLICARIS